MTKQESNIFKNYFTLISVPKTCNVIPSKIYLTNFFFDQNNDLLDIPYYNLDKDHKNIQKTISFRESPIPAPVQFHANPFTLHFHVLV